MALRKNITVTTTSPKGGSEEPITNSPKEPGQGQGQVCLCSPTTHPGSFRCRFHRPGSTAWFKRSNSMPAARKTSDSYALCRVFKKNGVCAEIEDQIHQGPSSSLTSSSNNNNNVNSEYNYSQAVAGININNNHDYETMSPDMVPLGTSSSSCLEAEDMDKDDSWMQFITDDAWCSSSTTAPLIEDVAFAN